MFQISELIFIILHLYVYPLRFLFEFLYIYFKRHGNFFYSMEFFCKDITEFWNDFISFSYYIKDTTSITLSPDHINLLCGSLYYLHLHTRFYSLRYVYN